VSDRVFMLRHGHKEADYPLSGEIRESREQIISFMHRALDDLVEIITK
jgi:hypothetical protein